MGWFVDMLRMLVLNAIVGFKDFLRLLKLAVQDKQVPCGLLFPHAHTPSVWFVCVCVFCVFTPIHHRNFTLKHLQEC
jgi:hypothetical protein